ncbi:GCN5 family acetyltransferase [Pedobacter kyungheensis]|uniref:GCN5 family acetyltransferase n=1 Tax=Pedobacter kyungheensis TaxID=1069985 RepID=A0A0C1FMG9_9SPHI|nr:GNAT family N-acetyltransferase [Pedobacter kyungheensis]KIA94122.1 GCN5 family acetyltransferase [Pedobacter kyungheensis]
MEQIKLSDIQIRNHLAPGDLGYLAYIHGDLYAKECNYGLKFEAYVLEGLKEFALAYDPEKDKIWICEHQEKMIGCLVAQHRKEQLQFRYFILQPEYRGIGLGKLLMQEFIDFMHSRNVKHAYLWTTADQDTATALYERFGFKLTAENPSDHFGKAILERRFDLKIPEQSTT